MRQKKALRMLALAICMVLLLSTATYAASADVTTPTQDSEETIILPVTALPGLPGGPIITPLGGVDPDPE